MRLSMPCPAWLLSTEGLGDDGKGYQNHDGEPGEFEERPVIANCHVNDQHDHSDEDKDPADEKEPLTPRPTAALLRHASTVRRGQRGCGAMAFHGYCADASPDLALAGHNGGPGDVLAFGCIPPFAETSAVTKLRALASTKYAGGGR